MGCNTCFYYLPLLTVQSYYLRSKSVIFKLQNAERDGHLQMLLWSAAFLCTH